MDAGIGFMTNIIGQGSLKELSVEILYEGEPAPGAQRVPWVLITM